MGEPGLGPSAAGRFQGALAYGVSRLRRREYLAAYRDFLRAAGLADGQRRELARGLAHLAAAGYRRARGDERGSARQLTHARRRLAPFLRSEGRLDVSGLLDAVERDGCR